MEGGSHPEELVGHAAVLGLHSLALTDRDGLYGIVRFSKEAKSKSVKAICGAELTIGEEGESHTRPRIVLLVEDEAGYANLVELISIAQMRGSKHDARLSLEDFQGRTAGLSALSASANGEIERALLRGEREQALRIAATYRQVFGDRFYVELQHHLRPQDATLINAQLDLARAVHLPIVATNGVVYATKEDAHLADLLLCIKHKTTLSKAQEALLLRPNGEFFLKTPQMMAQIFAPYPQAI
ncbi:MAG: hypothetical protein NVS9B12_13120 [Vulcanimicrobiaceae bacterium]